MRVCSSCYTSVGAAAAPAAPRRFKAKRRQLGCSKVSSEGRPEVRAATPRNAPRAEHRLSQLSSLYEERTPPGRGSVRERRHLDRCRLGSEIRRRKLLLSDKRSLYPAGLSGCDPDLVGRVLADVREEEAADAIPARTLSGSGSGAAPPAVLAGAGDSAFTNLVSAPVISDSSDDGGGTSSAVSTQVPRAVAKPSHQPTAQLPQLEISVLAGRCANDATC
mmetsp:Transcript_18523/g.54361  ORF Transcript_18523/g.54361 Transcript_18523/m.54361 type:complete len:220 (-) Transcript_18523:2782-3441(-)